MFKKIIPILIFIFMSCGSQKSTVVKTSINAQAIKINDLFAKDKPEKKPENKFLSNPIADEAAEINAAKQKILDTVKPKIVVNEKDTINTIPDEFNEPKGLKNTNQETIVNNVEEKLNPEVQTLTATSTVKVTKIMVQAYIEKYKQLAKDEMIQYGVPASIKLAQAILESGCETGLLCSKTNNHFGIKCKDDWKGESFKYTDDAPNECFRKYESAESSFKDHSQFLISRPWYNNLFKLSKDDYKGWSRGLKTAGYATDSKYPEKLIQIIELYNLNLIDSEVLGNQIVNLNKIETSSEKPIEVQIISNSENTYIVQPKEGLYSISKKFNLTVDQLKKLNNLTDNNIAIGQVLKIK